MATARGELKAGFMRKVFLDFRGGVRVADRCWPAAREWDLTVISARLWPASLGRAVLRAGQGLDPRRSRGFFRGRPAAGRQVQGKQASRPPPRVTVRDQTGARVPWRARSFIPRLLPMCAGLRLVEASIKLDMHLAGQHRAVTARAFPVNRRWSGDDLHESAGRDCCRRSCPSVLAGAVCRHTHRHAGLLRVLADGQAIGPPQFKQAPDLRRGMSGGPRGPHRAQIKPGVQVGVTRRLRHEQVPHVVHARSQSETALPIGRLKCGTQTVHIERTPLRSDPVPAVLDLVSIQ